MKRRILLAMLIVLLLIPPVSVRAAEADSAEPKTVPLISWRPEEEAENYIIAFIEPRTDIEAYEKPSVVTLTFENNSETKLQFYDYDIFMLKRTGYGWVTLHDNVVKNAGSKLIAAEHGKTIRQEIDLRDYGIFTPFENPANSKGHYALAVYCYDADGGLTVALADFCVNNMGYVSMYLEADVPVDYKDVGKSFGINGKLEFTEYPANPKEFASVYTSSGVLSYGADRGIVIKQVGEKWYRVPEIEINSFGAIGISYVSADLDDKLSADFYGHEFTDGLYLIKRSGLKWVNYLEFTIDSSLTTPR
jgi:hypothetical protein